MRMLVVGGSSYVGRTLLAALGSTRAIGTYATQAFAGGIRFDARTMRFAEIQASLGPGITHAAILLAGKSLDEYARDRAGTWRLHVRATIELIADLHEAGIVPIFASSDAVFDGRGGGYREDSPTAPILTYGRQKLAVEAFLATLPGPWLALRLSKVVGPDARGTLGAWRDQLCAGEVLRCAHDQRFSPAHRDDVVRAIIALAEAGAAGLYHCGGPDSVSRLELARILARHVPGAAKGEAIIPCSIKDFPFIEERPLDTTLVSQKLYNQLGWCFRSMEAACAEAGMSFAGAQAASPPARSRVPGES